MDEKNSFGQSSLERQPAAKGKKTGSFNPLYLAIGSGLGLAFGIPSGNPPIGIAVGIGVGAVLGFIIRKKD